MASTHGVVVHIIEDDANQRVALGSLLRIEGFEAVEHASACAFLAALEGEGNALRCALTDIRMPGTTGLQLQQTMARRGISIPMVFITGFADVSVAVEAMRNGAVDFVEKPFEERRLLQAVARAVDVAHRSRTAGIQGEPMTRVSALAARERQVLELLISGLSNKAIALRLGLSVRTVEGYRAAMMRKLDAASLSEAVRIGLAAGISPRPDRWEA